MVRFGELELGCHYAKHAAEYGEIGPEEYERLASEFLLKPKDETMRECMRKNGDMLRYDPSGGNFGALTGGNRIRTFFKPVPCIDVPPESDRPCHGHRDNFAYFQFACRRAG